MSSDKTSTLLLLGLTIFLLVALSTFAPIPEVTGWNSNKSIPEFRVGSKKVKKRRKVVIFSEWHPAEAQDLSRNVVLNVTTRNGPSNGVVSKAEEVHMENDLTAQHAAVASSPPSVSVASWLQLPRRTRTPSSSAKNVAAAAESYQESRTTKIVLAGTKGGGRANTRVFRAHGVKKSRADIDQHEYSAFASSSVAFFPSQAHDETLANDEVVIVGGLGAELVGTGEPVLVLAIRRSGPKLGGEATFAALLHRKWMKRNQPRKAGRIRRSNVRKRRSRLSQPKNPGGGSQEVVGMAGASKLMLASAAGRPFRTREIVLRQRVPQHEASTSGLASLRRHHRVLPLFI